VVALLAGDNKNKIFMLPSVYYLSNSDRSPIYGAGKELHTIEYNRGWVEYLLQTSDLYFVKMTDSLIKKYQPVATRWIELAWHNQNQKHLALLKQLANVRLEQPFNLPLFTDWRQGEIFTCGNTRFTAEIICGTCANQIPLFVQTKKGVVPDQSVDMECITSTLQAETLSNIQNTDYKLSFAQSAQPVVINSILKNSVYETDPDYSTFEENGHFIMDFWKKFIHDGRINITVTCNKNSVQFIKFNPDIWNVNFVFKEMSGFSFGEILSKFNRPDNQDLNLYVYDPLTLFDLAYLLPWTTSNSVWYHTVNKKIHLFDTSRGSATACWPIVPMGNFVN
jgi:hypothetical protein